MALGRKPIEIVKEGKHQLLTKADHWGRINLSEVAVVQNGFAFSSTNFTKNKGLPLIRIRDIDSDSTVDRYSGDYSKDFIVRKGDILIGMDGDFKASIWKGEDALLNQRVCRIIPKSNSFHPKFLFICLQPYLNAINEETSSVTVKHLSSRTIEEIPLPLPPFKEQLSIISKIEELLSDLENGKQQLILAQQQLKVYRQSLLNATVTEKNVKSIESVIEKLDQGWSPRCLNDDSKDNDEWAVIKTTAVQHGHFVPIENKILPSGLKPRVQHELKVGDILITRAGPRIRVGVCCMVRTTRPKLINCDKVYRIKVNVKIIKPEYLELILNTPYYLREIEKMKSGISDSGLNLTQSKFLKIEIPIPSIEEQLYIINELESKLTVCDKIEEIISQSQQEAETLRQSILKKAFEGKLV